LAGRAGLHPSKALAPEVRQHLLPVTPIPSSFAAGLGLAMAQVLVQIRNRDFQIGLLVIDTVEAVLREQPDDVLRLRLPTTTLPPTYSRM
jgi:hypothetical protein